MFVLQSRVCVCGASWCEKKLAREHRNVAGVGELFQSLVVPLALSFSQLLSAYFSSTSPLPAPPLFTELQQQQEGTAAASSVCSSVARVQLLSQTSRSLLLSFSLPLSGCPSASLPGSLPLSGSLGLCLSAGWLKWRGCASVVVVEAACLSDKGRHGVVVCWLFDGPARRANGRERLAR
ncbi:hypothetical protein DPEC_G00136890 [Dallia pectoralis]|uniref:Uncharacterized protein n=1 Tax=Dallia pectoralis TaxID=75939 RepID=A0ACC2GLS6_DALPE|nr:hypothetical protein DPEC_G00136890 [Dallia pectoralis]